MIPLWLKLAYTAMVAITVVVYWIKYGPGNFLWFSDVAMLLTVPALWLEGSLLASMAALAVLLPEAFWNVSWFGRLLTRKRVSGLTDYMFDAKLPLYLRALSLFHVWLPPLLLWLVFTLGYDPRALAAQTLLAWAVLPASYLLTPPKDNVNWVHRFGAVPITRLRPWPYVGLTMLVFPVLIYLPTDLALRWWLR